MNYKDALGWSASFMKNGLAAFLVLFYNGENITEGIKTMLNRMVSSVSFSAEEYAKGTSRKQNTNDCELLESRGTFNGKQNLRLEYKQLYSGRRAFHEELRHFRMITQGMPELNEQIADIVVPSIGQERLEAYQTEKECIASLTKAEDIVAYMRKIKDPSNGSLLIDKAIEYQDTVMPLVMKRIHTSGHDVFIESAAILLANAEDKYPEELYEIFDDIRNPYAISELCIVFGVKKMKKCTDLLLKQFIQIKQERPDLLMGVAHCECNVAASDR